MSRIGRGLFLLGILVSLLAGAAVFVMLVSNQPQPEKVPTTKVVIAFQNIAPRTEVGPEQVGVADWPRAVPTPIGSYERTVDVVGKMALSPVYPGVPVTDKMVMDKRELKETHSNAALILEKGSVAVAFPVTVKSSVANAIQAGDRVDVIATFRSQTATANPANAVATQRLLADMLIIQVGPWSAPSVKKEGSSTSSSSSSSSTSTSIITLQLKEQDVLVLEYAQEFASSVTLVLRPANDRDLITLEPVTFDYINQRFGYKLAK